MNGIERNGWTKRELKWSVLKLKSLNNQTPNSTFCFNSAVGSLSFISIFYFFLSPTAQNSPTKDLNMDGNKSVEKGPIIT